MLKKALKFAVFKIKGRRLNLDERVGNLDLLFLFFYQAASLVRGMLKCQKVIFLGASVVIQSKRKASFGKGVTIGNNTIINALGTNGFRIGQGSSIGSFSILRVSGTLYSIGKEIRIGKNVGIGDFAHIGGAGGVFIGDDTIAGAYLSIHPENHVFSKTDILIRDQGVTREGIYIGSNCWIGAKVTFLDGSKVGNGCVIAAGAVVRGVFPDNVVIGGVPARILKERCDEK